MRWFLKLAATIVIVFVLVAVADRCSADPQPGLACEQAWDGGVAARLAGLDVTELDADDRAAFLDRLEEKTGVHAKPQAVFRFMRPGVLKLQFVLVTGPCVDAIVDVVFVPKGAPI